MRALAAALLSLALLGVGSVPANAHNPHRVKRGESLSTIASEHGTTVRRLLRLNPRKIRDRDVIFPGQRLKTKGHAPKARKRHQRRHYRRVRPPLPTAGSWNYHSGYPWALFAVDITVPGSADCGNPVGAARAGRVVDVNHWNFSYGTHVVIRGAKGRYRYYAHLSGERVRVGQHVRRGQMIGRVGTTGNSSGCHLHYEVRPGTLGGIGDLAYLYWPGRPRRHYPWSIVWRRVAMCESGMNGHPRWHVNTGNGYYGGLQFGLPTWREFGGRRYARYPHRATAKQQKRIAEKVLHSYQGIGAWPTCGLRAL